MIFDQKMCLKSIWFCSFNDKENFAEKRFLIDGDFPCLKKSTLNFQLTFLKDCPTSMSAIFLKMSHSFFIAILYNTST